MRKILLLLAIGVIVAGGWYRLAQRPVDANDQMTIEFTVHPGMPLTAIAARLEAENLTRSARAFAFFARVHGAQRSIQAGHFFLKRSMTSAQILETLRKGFSQEKSITVPEGFTVQDIDLLLAAKGVLEPGEFMDCARTCALDGYGFLPAGKNLAKRGGRVEGYLFPDTYFVALSASGAENLLTRMLDNFRVKVIDGLGTEIAASKKPLHEIVTMASLIEEETRHDNERTIVSGILWKRLREGVSLGVDAAVRYIVDKPSSAITLADLDVDSPYNLRKFLGLPPGPIASPGLDSIRAALKPQDSAYWYYLHDAQGTIHYAETNDAHNENKRLYLR